MPKDTKSLGNNKAPACESRGFVRKRKKGCILTHLLMISGWVLLIYTFYKGTFLFVHGEILCFMQQMYKISRIKEAFQTL